MEAPLDAPLDGLLAEREAVSGLARRLSGRDVHAAEDLEQEVWAAALAHPPRESTSLRGWLRAVTRSRSVERLRRRGRAGRAEREAARDEAVEAADEAVARRDQAARLAHALRELGEPYRSVLLLRYVEDLAPREAARRLGRPVETVRTQTRRGLQLLRRKLEARETRRPTWALWLFALRRPRAHAPAVFGAVAGVAALVVLALGLGRLGRSSADAAEPLAAAPAPAPAPAPATAAAREADAAGAPAHEPVEFLAAARETHSRWVDVALSDERGGPLVAAEVAVIGHGGARPAGRTDARGRLRVALDLADLASAQEHWPLARDAVELAFRSPRRATLHAFVFLPESGGTPVEAALLQPERALAGRVIDDQGRPLAGAEVHAGPARGLGARQRLGDDDRALAVVRAETATTDAAGRFTLDGLPREALRVAARADGHALVAQEVTLEQGEVELALAPAEPLRGVVRLGGRPAAGARVEWSAGDGSGWPAAWCRARADGAGRFELPRPAQGALALAAELDHARAAGTLELGYEPPSWTAELARVSELRLRLLESDGRPAAGLYLSLRCAADGRVLGAAESDAEGRASFAVDEPGPCDLVVLPARGENPWPREILRDLLGDDGPELALRLAPDGGTAELAARFAPGSPARLVLLHVEGRVEHSAVPDEHGRLVWAELPAGRWSACAYLGEGRERSLGEFELGPGEALDLGRIE